MFSKKSLFIAAVATSLFAASCLKNDSNIDTPTYQNPALETNSIDSFTNAMGYYGMAYDSYYTGFKYEVLDYGDTITVGSRPSNSYPIVTVAYKGTLLNGNVIDSTSTLTTSSDTVRTFNALQILQAWQIALNKIGSGGHIRFVTPSAYAYGSQSNSAIPANSPLFFDIRLKKVSAY